MKGKVAFVSCACLLAIACNRDDAGSGRPQDGIGGGNGGSGPASAGTAAAPGGRLASAGAGNGVATGSAGTSAIPSGGPTVPPPVVGGTGATGRGPTTPPAPAAGSGSAPPTIDPSSCPTPPADATPEQIMAFNVVNNYRVPAGAGCQTMVSEIAKAATNHCTYYAGFTKGDMCIANPHNEVMGCAGFSGVNPGDRMKAAGYMSFGGSEVMAFVNNPQNAVDTWVNSVWHRVPIIDPWTTHMGYGSAASCDTIDFGRGTTPAPADTVVVFPYDGQTNVPTAFNGQYEGPMPPTPASGWPSSAPISVHAQKLMITEHVLTLDGDATPIEHVWLDAQAEIVEMSMRRSLTNVVFMYANLPFAANTKYRVKISGSYGSGMLAKEWTFTTGAAPAWPRR